MDNLFSEIIARIKGLKGLKNQKEVGKLLGFNATAFTERKVRGAIPEKELKILAAKEGIAEKWLFTGEGPIHVMVQEIMGHSEISTTMVYAEVIRDHLHREMSKLKFELR